jgi:hypothetical protein
MLGHAGPGQQKNRLTPRRYLLHLHYRRPCQAGLTRENMRMRTITKTVKYTENGNLA